MYDPKLPAIALGCEADITYDVLPAVHVVRIALPNSAMRWGVASKSIFYIIVLKICLLPVPIKTKVDFKRPTNLDENQSYLFYNQ